MECRRKDVVFKSVDIKVIKNCIGFKYNDYFSAIPDTNATMHGE